MTERLMLEKKRLKRDYWKVRVQNGGRRRCAENTGNKESERKKRCVEMAHGYGIHFIHLLTHE
jgi:hypothetical protein